MPVHGINGCTEFGSCNLFPCLESILKALTTYDFNSQLLEKQPPECLVLHKVEGIGQPDGRLIYSTFSLPWPYCLQKPPAFPHQVEVLPCLPYKFFGLVISSTEKTIGQFLALHLCHRDGTMVQAEITSLGLHRNLLFIEVQSPELRNTFMLLLNDQGCSQGTGEMTEWGNKERFTQTLLKCSNKGPVFCGGSLEADLLTYVRLTGHLFQVILPYGMNHSGKHFFHTIALAKELVDVPFHKYRAAITCKWSPPSHGQTLIILQLNAQPAGKLFNETPCACCTNRIHVGESDHSPFHLSKLCVLSANLDNRISIRIQFIGSPCMGSNLIHILVSTHNPTNKLTARARSPTAQKIRFNTMVRQQAVHGFKNCLNSE